MSSAARASVVVPAHDEGAGIVRTLSTLLAGANEDEFEVVVVCNGCTDDTAMQARSVPGVEVREIGTASKVAALREGDRATEVFPRIYLDADVRLTTDAARALADALMHDDALVAGIPGRYDLRDASPLVSLFYEFRQRLPVFADGIIGAGVYAMSAAGRARFGEWPEVLGDDQFVYRLFTADERAVVSGHRTTVVPAFDLRTVIRRGVRVRRGNDQLSVGAETFARLPPPPAGVWVAMRSSLATPKALASVPVFVAVTVAIRLQARRRHGGDWERVALHVPPGAASVARPAPITVDTEVLDSTLLTRNPPVSAAAEVPQVLGAIRALARGNVALLALVALLLAGGGVAILRSRRPTDGA